jgi:hypothetical protein
MEFEQLLQQNGWTGEKENRLHPVCVQLDDTLEILTVAGMLHGHANRPMRLNLPEAEVTVFTWMCGPAKGLKNDGARQDGVHRRGSRLKSCAGASRF